MKMKKIPLKGEMVNNSYENISFSIIYPENRRETKRPMGV